MKRYYFATLLSIFAIMTASAQLSYNQSIVGTWLMPFKGMTMLYSFDNQGRAALKCLAKVKEVDNLCDINVVATIPGTVKMMGKAISINFNENALSGDIECDLYPDAIEKSKSDSHTREAIDYIKKNIAAIDKGPMVSGLKSDLSKILVPHYMQITYCKGKTLILSDPRQGRMEFTYVGPANLSPKKVTSTSTTGTKGTSAKGTTTKPVQRKATGPRNSSSTRK
jgi:hypothetical protein